MVGLVLAEGVDLHDVGVVQPGDRLRLGAEAHRAAASAAASNHFSATGRRNSVCQAR